MSLDTSPLVIWKPQPGPQTRFLAAGQGEVFYGGAAFGGKSDALIHVPLYHMQHPLGRALVLRFSFPELRELMDRCMAEFPRLGATWSATDKRWLFPGGGIYRFGYCETYADALQYQGDEFSCLCYDELGKLQELRTWLFLISRVRAKTDDLRIMVRGTGNPGGAGHGWIKQRYILPTKLGAQVYRDPTSGLTRRFIPARAQDNPIGMRNDPGYVQRLLALPEVLRRQLLEGDWNAGEGLALGELMEPVHVVEPHAIPRSWTWFGGLDWGFAHWWTFVLLAVSPDKRAVVVDGVRGRKEYIDTIGDRIIDLLAEYGVRSRLEAIAGGLDLWHERRAKEENGVTYAEVLLGMGLPLVKATVSRVSGLNNLREWVKHLGQPGPAGFFPRLTFMRRPAIAGHDNALFQQLQVITTDPDRPEDALKIDCDPDSGDGGDDWYDALRYAMMLRPWAEEPAGRDAPPPNVSDDRDILRGPEHFLGHSTAARERPEHGTGQSIGEGW